MLYCLLRALGCWGVVLVETARVAGFQGLRNGSSFAVFAKRLWARRSGECQTIHKKPKSKNSHWMNIFARKKTRAEKVENSREINAPAKSRKAQQSKVEKQKCSEKPNSSEKSKSTAKV